MSVLSRIWYRRGGGSARAPRCRMCATPWSPLDSPRCAVARRPFNMGSLPSRTLAPIISTKTTIRQVTKASDSGPIVTGVNGEKEGAGGNETGVDMVAVSSSCFAMHGDACGTSTRAAVSRSATPQTERKHGRRRGPGDASRKRKRSAIARHNRASTGATAGDDTGDGDMREGRGGVWCRDSTGWFLPVMSQKRHIVTVVLA